MEKPWSCGTPRHWMGSEHGWAFTLPVSFPQFQLDLRRVWGEKC